MSNELSTREKAAILFKHGLIRREDRFDDVRIAARWHIYETVQQKTIKTARPKSER